MFSLYPKCNPMNPTDKTYLSDNKIFTHYSNINYDNLLERGVLIVDVRTSAEYLKDHIQGAINIPLRQLKKNLNELNKNMRPVLFYCKSGKRSQKAYHKALEQRVDCYHGGTMAEVHQALQRHQYVFVSRVRSLSLYS